MQHQNINKVQARKSRQNTTPKCKQSTSLKKSSKYNTKMTRNLCLRLHNFLVQEVLIWSMGRLVDCFHWVLWQSMIVHYMVDVILIVAYCEPGLRLLPHDDVAIEADKKATAILALIDGQLCGSQGKQDSTVSGIFHITGTCTAISFLAILHTNITKL